ncbi:MAG: DUF2093 domain-containing protein [Alphaproteobacteria bacterium]|nr:DUF2093 domain-containing protein [Alphaproteobacteria bacterium]
MNFQSRPEGGAREAKLRYLPGDYLVLSPGSFVRCAVSGQAIPLDDLRYWSAEVQEPYASADIAFGRYEQLKAEGRV